MGYLRIYCAVAFQNNDNPTQYNAQQAETSYCYTLKHKMPENRVLISGATASFRKQTAPANVHL